MNQAMDEPKQIMNSVVKKETTMQMGMVGLGRRGADMVLRLTNGGYACCASKLTVREHGHAPHREHSRGAVKPSVTGEHFYPMYSGEESDQLGDCPKYGVALEKNPASHPLAAGQVIQTYQI
jgi:hypothetical protein